ncbi:uncharacterized protein LOC129317614 [Prosopis cineraria]|uniref:uncharacterized protein LOC129317614 n=1 Tax=Prosopis cineraria TaxID=364024 RepID=UPI00240EA28D|nr:uncharacterized protein LOC129317614 [Prosopis cineraria]
MDFSNQVEDRNRVKEKLEEKKSKASKPSSAGCWSDFRSFMPRFSPVDTVRNAASPLTVKTTFGKARDEAKMTAQKGVNPVLTTASSNSNSMRRRLLEVEINRRCELGLCFKCEEKFRPNYKYKNKQLQLLVLKEEEIDEIGPGKAHELSNQMAEKAMSSMELSMTIAIGLTRKRTLKMVGEAHGQKVVILIDCKATHNFVAHTLIKQLRIPMETVKKYFVIVGDGR